MIQPLLPNHIADFASSGRRLETIRRWPIRDAPKARVPDFRSQFKVSATNGLKSNDDVDARPSRSLPEELARLPQWVNWEYHQRNGKAPKCLSISEQEQRPPAMTPRGKISASPRSAQAGRPGWAWVPASSPYVGIDLDKCHDPETYGAQITLLCFWRDT